MSSTYLDFLASKALRAELRGLDTVPDLAPHLFPFQRACVEANLRVGGAGLFLDCVAGETIIDGPDGGAAIADLAAAANPIRVYSLDDSGKPVIALATSPFRKGMAALYRVTTECGLSILATPGHRFLTPSGWTSMCSLRPGASLLVSAVSRPSSTSERDHSASPRDDLGSIRKPEDSTDDCYRDSRRYGQRLRSAVGIDRSSSQSQVDAHERGGMRWREDDRAHKSARNHLRRDSARHSMPDSDRQGNCTEDGFGFRALASDSELSVSSNQSAPRFDQAAIRRSSSCAVLTAEDQESEGVRFSLLNTSLDTVSGVEYIRTDDYFDLHVPGFENYLAHGFWNHNTGLGKTACELEWCRHAAEATNGRALILTPLAVARQIEREGRRWGYEINVIREQSEARDGISVCNYDRLEKLDPHAFGAVALDESSILKSFTGKTTRALIEQFGSHRFRLSATATPAPNDHMELGQHAEFLGVMRSVEMLSRFFINDTSQASQHWRLKRHGVGAFWDWVASWARAASMPSDLGDSDDGFVLPPLNLTRHRAQTVGGARIDGSLFADAVSATNMHDIKRQTSKGRAELAASIVADSPNGPWVLWLDTDYEADAVMAALADFDGVAEVRGSHPIERKEETLAAFADGGIRILVTKPSVTGFGLNWQHCARTVFVGRTFSYEAWYQAVRRLWRFGQTRPVECHVIVAEGEDSIGRVIDRKAGDHDSMKREMRAAMRRALETTASVRVPYDPRHDGRLPSWLSAA